MRYFGRPTLTSNRAQAQEMPEERFNIILGAKRGLVTTAGIEEKFDIVLGFTPAA